MTNTISHRGYVGEVSIDIEDNCLYAKLINAPGVHFTCEGETVKELVDAFASWIDDYVEGFNEANLKVVEPLVLAAT
ncbi:MAG: hypothetical protein AAFZ17_01495 [Cyanobacteria bacterium J06650_10]